MFVHWIYWLHTRGRFSATHTISLDRDRRYLVTGALTGKSGSDYGQIFVSTLCDAEGMCDIRDVPTSTPEFIMSNLNFVFLPRHAIRVTVKLRGDGGLHKAEGVVYDVT